MEVKARVHLHNHKEPNGRAFIVADKAGLRELGQALINVSKSNLGTNEITVYQSDGHSYKVFITCDVSEDEWQKLPVPYSKEHNPENLNIVKTYYEFMKK